jgi:hypothetical protein
MVSLRTLAIASNVAFIAYGYLDTLWPILILHATMLPMNVLRLRQELARAAPRPAVRTGPGPRQRAPRHRTPRRPHCGAAPTPHRRRLPGHLRTLIGARLPR